MKKTIEEILKSYSADMDEVIQAIKETTSNDLDEDKGLPVDNNLMAAAAILEHIQNLIVETVTFHECPACGVKTTNRDLIEVDGEDYFRCCNSAIDNDKLYELEAEIIELNRKENEFTPIETVIGEEYRIRNFSGVKHRYRNLRVRVVTQKDMFIEAELLEGREKGQLINFFRDSFVKIPTFEVKNECQGCIEAVIGCDKYHPGNCPETTKLCKECSKAKVLDCSLAACIVEE